MNVRKVNKNLKQFNIWMDKRIVREMDKVAKLKGMNRSEFITNLFLKKMRIR